MTIRNILEIDEDKCNGCGNCVLGCAEGVIKIVDGKAKIVSLSQCDGLGACLGTCPTGALTIVQKEAPEFKSEIVQLPHACPSLKFTPGQVNQNWPIQLALVNAEASFFKDCSLVLAADCTAFSVPNFQDRYLKDQVLLIACPKLDRQDYIAKLADIFQKGGVKAVTVIRMQVPCCAGLTRIVQEAINISKANVVFTEEIIK
jgi:Fe-S-cluster-containing hydrogenase component 2